MLVAALHEQRLHVHTVMEVLLLPRLAVVSAGTPAFGVGVGLDDLVAVAAFAAVAFAAGHIDAAAASAAAALVVAAAPEAYESLVPFAVAAAAEDDENKNASA